MYYDRMPGVGKKYIWRSRCIDIAVVEWNLSEKSEKELSRFCYTQEATIKESGGSSREKTQFSFAGLVYMTPSRLFRLGAADVGFTVTLPFLVEITAPSFPYTTY